MKTTFTIRATVNELHYEYKCNLYELACYAYNLAKQAGWQNIRISCLTSRR